MLPTNLILALLLVAALYSGAMWLWLSGVSYLRRRYLECEDLDAIERYTFHLGLCFILCLGFLGVIGGRG